LAKRIVGLPKDRVVALDSSWGLIMGRGRTVPDVPEADIPVVQLSLNRSIEAAGHYALGQELKQLRREGVLILGAGILCTTWA